MEILSPAESSNSLIAAVRSGADVVYLDDSAFSARATAKNLDDDALRQVVGYCHTRGVKVYLAFNTLLWQGELPATLELAEYICSLAVDALIVQDPGLIALPWECAPRLKLSASMQISITNLVGARLFVESGFAQVVLARELSLSQIHGIKGDTKGMFIEIENFVHGVLYMSVSDRCYFSSVFDSCGGSQSMRAQPCRLSFSMPGGTGHDLNLKDLSMIARISELENAGITNAKIEDHVKRPEYMVAAAATCQHSADGQPAPSEPTEGFSAVFSRSGPMAGYPDGKLGRKMSGIRSKEDMIGAAKGAFGQLHALCKDELPRVPAWLKLMVRAGQSVTLSVTDDGDHRAEVLGECPESTLSRPIDKERCHTQLQKTDGTPLFA